MAKLSALIPAVASSLGIPEKTVAIYARHLRKARLLSTGGRGPGGAEMTPADCANLLIAILAADYAKNAAETVLRYRALLAGREQTRWQLPHLPLPPLTELPEHHPFGQALEALIAASKDGALEAALNSASEMLEQERIPFPVTLEILVVGPVPVARISLWASKWGESVGYAAPDPWLKSDEPSEKEVSAWNEEIQRHGPLGDLEQVRRISAKTILVLGQLLRR